MDSKTIKESAPLAEEESMPGFLISKYQTYLPTKRTKPSRGLFGAGGHWIVKAFINVIDLLRGMAANRQDGEDQDDASDAQSFATAETHQSAAPRRYQLGILPPEQEDEKSSGSGIIGGDGPWNSPFLLFGLKWFPNAPSAGRLIHGNYIVRAVEVYIYARVGKRRRFCASEFFSPTRTFTESGINEASIVSSFVGTPVQSEPVQAGDAQMLEEELILKVDSILHLSIRIPTAMLLPARSVIPKHMVLKTGTVIPKGTVMGEFALYTPGLAPASQLARLSSE
ncbi:hypothetical protein EJ06DRAFT_565979 [Trichodelitschia bisporula]|uniref:Uncharacterized protein n=1 Tax=Trichodelitschia bisporula TaxID=703511 RepID=A0A6G1HP55_9PEZI|nr:hypothetical protein EJ06DRAFT_565979 [Trichodelitschia bisporula]